jgi:hypothetical protein
MEEFTLMCECECECGKADSQQTSDAWRPAEHRRHWEEPLCVCSFFHSVADLSNKIRLFNDFHEIYYKKRVVRLLRGRVSK